MKGKELLLFLKNWTLPVAIAVGVLCYLPFYWTPALDTLGTRLGFVISRILPVAVFLTLFVTFCKVDFRQMRPHRWHASVLMAQLLLVGIGLLLAFEMEDDSGSRLLCESVLVCVIAPSASAAPVVVGKMGGNIHTMTTFTLLSALASSLLIPLVFPHLSPLTSHLSPLTFLLIFRRVALVLLLPLALGWLVRHYVRPLQRRILAVPDLGFYLWAVALAITAGITVRNILHSGAGLVLLLEIAVATLLLSIVQFAIGRAVGRWMGDALCGGQALFQKNMGFSIWVANLYLNPISSVGAGCYVLWQNLINSVELWAYRRIQSHSLTTKNDISKKQPIS